MNDQWPSIPRGFAIVEAGAAPWDGQHYLVVCLRCDWETRPITDLSVPFRKHGAATQHNHDKHGVTA